MVELGGDYIFNINPYSEFRTFIERSRINEENDDGTSFRIVYNWDCF